MKKKLLVVLLALCVLAACSSCSKETPKWNGFRGINWGATKDEIIKIEGKEPYMIEPDVTTTSGQVLTILTYEGESVSKFTDNVAVGYDLISNHLVSANYWIRSLGNIDEDYNYLQKALSETYGNPSDKGLDAVHNFMNIMGGSMDTFEKYTSWFVDGTGIVLYVMNGSLCIIYLGNDYINSMGGESQGTDKINNNGL